ncbi:MAG: helix-turn-helix transcriptional regulator [Pseudomonadota bacterium]
MPASDLSPSRKDAIARVRTALIEKKMTQAELADAADCHEKTIQNMLGGRKVRDQTLFDVCMVLGLNFEQLKGEWIGEASHYDVPGEMPGLPAKGPDVAPVYMGAYTKLAVDQMIGSYLTIRPAFAVPDTVIAYRTDIDWDPSWPSLVFQEKQRPDAAYSHRGRLHIPASSMFLHLVSLTKGAMRMIIVSQLDQLDRMHGLITTVSRHGAISTPVSAPIIYLKRSSDFADDGFADDAFGQLASDHNHYAGYRHLLNEATDAGYARVVT